MKKKKAWVPIKKLPRNDSATTSFSSMEQQKIKSNPSLPSSTIEQQKNKTYPSLPSSTIEQQKNKIHPSLPSNYVTLAHLQERWLKQKNQINQQKNDEEEKAVAVAVVAPTNVTVSRSHSTEQRQQEEKAVAVAVTVVAPTNGAVSRSRQAQRRKNRIRSSRKGSGEEATSENRRKLENGGEIGENHPKSDSGTRIGEIRLESKIGEEKEKPVAVAVVAPTNVAVSRSHSAPVRRLGKNRKELGNKRRTNDAAFENRLKLEDGAEIGKNILKSGTGAGIGENILKSETGAEIGENRLKSETGAEIGENRWKSEIGDGIGEENADRIGESKKEKKKKWKKKRKGKMKMPKVEEEKEGNENGTAEHENEVAEKTTIESELNDEKNVNSIVEIIEEKFGDLSMNPKNGKLNGSPESQSQLQSNYRRGGYGYGRFRGQRRVRGHMIWVKKDI